MISTNIILSGKNVLLTIVVLFCSFTANVFSQDNVGIGTTTPDPSAILDLEATDMGFLVPRLTTVQRDAVVTPATGLIIYNASNNAFEFYNGTVWEALVTNTSITLSDGNILVGNNSGIATSVAMSGDISIDNTGLTSLQNNSVDGAHIDLTGNANGDMMYYNGTDWVRLAPGTAGEVLETNGAGLPPSWIAQTEGTVTSVDLSMPGIFGVSGNPITTSGTFNVTLNNQNQNLVFASPAGSNGAPSFRSLVTGDIPNIDASKINSGIFPIQRGGTGVGTTPVDGQLLIGNTASSGFSLATITAGSNITITNGNGSIEIAATAMGDGSVNNSTMHWNGTDWVENTQILTNAATLTIGSTSNQGNLIINDANNETATILTADLLGNRQYVLPVIGTATANFVVSEGDQIINGSKTFNNLVETVSGLEINNSGVAQTLSFYENNANGADNISFAAPSSLASSTSYILPDSDGGLGEVLSTDGSGNLSWIAGGGTVTSVDLSMPGIFGVSGNPITTSGTFNVTLNNQNQNLVFASPAGSNGIPSFRSLVANDIPNIDASKINSGIFPIQRGGTGVGTTPVDGQLLIGNTASSGFSLATITAGSNITITNGNGSIEIAASVTGMADGTVNNSTIHWNGVDWVENTQILTNAANLTIGSSSNQGNLVINDPNNETATILTADLLGNRQYVLPVIGTATANFVVSEGDQTINGSKTFNSLVETVSGLEINNSGVAQTLSFYEDNANGAENISFASPASLAVSTSYVLPDSDGGSGEVLSTDGAGNLSWIAAGSGGSNTLDQAYDTGGAGAGRTITADAGAVVINNTGGTNAPLEILNSVAGQNSLLVSSNSDDFIIDENGNIGVGVTPVNGQMQIASNYVHVGSSAGTVDLADSEGDMYVENDLEVDGDFKLGSSSTTLTKIIKVTVTNDVNIVVPQNNSKDHDFTVTGAEVGSTVFVSPEGDLNANYLGIGYAYVSSADTVRVRFMNVNNSQPRQIPLGTDFYITIIK